MPKRDRQRERQKRRARTSVPLGRGAAPDLRDGIPYRRRCHACGETREGMIGLWSPEGPPHANEAKAFELMVAEHGHYVCSECDPAGFQAWALDIQSHLNRRPLDDV